MGKKKNRNPGPLPKNFSDKDENDAVSEFVQKTREHNLKASQVALKHHTLAYRLSLGVLFWLMALIYFPLSVVLCKIIPSIWGAETGTAVFEALTSFAKSGGALVLVALYMAPIALLTGILKYTCLSGGRQSGSDSSDMTSFLKMPR